MNYDMTFCSDKKCNNLKCERNQNNITKQGYLIKNGIWISDFINCEDFKKEDKPLQLNSIEQ